MALAVLFRDSALAVVDKPAGLAVDEDILPLAAREFAPPGGRAWPRVVHRLDRGASGCLIVALRKDAEAGLKHSFDEGKIKKNYFCLVRGAPPDGCVHIDTPYGPDPHDRRRFTSRIDTPRRARLSYEVVERLRDAAAVRVELDTGRTHQIRVQMAESGFPLIGDEVYGAPGPRLMLHAERIEFPHPIEKKIIFFSSPLPEALRAVLAQLR